MSLIFWGTSVRHDPVGIVADLCPTCDTLQLQVIEDHFKSDHFQFIRISSWVFVGTTRRCVACQTERLCNKNSFAHIAPLAEEHLPIAELLARTNPRLEKTLQEDARREILGTTSDSAAISSRKQKRSKPAADPEARELLDALANEENDPEIFKLKEKLKLWSRLNAAQRLEVTNEVDAFRFRQRQLQDGKDFLISMALHYPNWAEKVGLGVSILLFLAWITLINVVDEELRWYFIFGGVPIMLVLLLFCSAMFSYMLAESWFRKTLLPRADAERIPHGVLVLLAKIPSHWNIDEWNAAYRILSHRELMATMILSKYEDPMPVP